ncbi:hypothetical protein KDL01_00780 [Actinospica durhamensis]|uniref:asparagine synthase (glutamine-hydrolyzing) n=1 Tax=Actinospica durhamensis TaxID=1508375 RepID=A0A941EIB8_9ACTN|nr:asparagine synthase-related protein [Actinospica durhamensis]MBR7831771.1 hypothetical protein [Actinospica durhamensis]
MPVDRSSIVPVSYISGSIGRGPRESGADLRPPLSAAALTSCSLQTPSSRLQVHGVVRQAQSLASHQWSDGVDSLVFSGDLYNLRSLTAMARAAVGSRVEIASAAQVLEILLRHRRDQFFAEVDGKFAIVRTGPWGAELIRDKMGEEQLYFGRCADRGLVFSSTIRPLVAHVEGAEFYVPDSVRVFETPVGAETMFRDIAKVEPGSLVRVAAARQAAASRYWEIRPSAETITDEAEAAEALRGVLTDSLRSRMPPTGEVSAYLSGGQDSSWVNCALAALGTPARTAYTTAFRELDSVYNEVPHAAKVAAHLGIEHLVLEPDAEDFAEHFPTTMAIFDEVKANAAHFTEYWIARAAAARGDRTLLSGYGADEALGGEVRYLVMYLDRDRTRNRGLFESNPMVANYAPLSRLLSAHAQDAPEWEKYYALMRRGAPTDGDEEPFRESVYSTFRRADRLIDQMGLTDIVISGQPLLDTAKVNKYWGIDKVCPFLDPRVVDLAFSLNERSKIRGLSTKSILRGISRGLVPDEITDRTDKVGFAFPHNEAGYADRIRHWADALARRTGREVRPDAGRGRYDRAVLMAASEELVRRSHEDGGRASRQENPQPLIPREC